MPFDAPELLAFDPDDVHDEYQRRGFVRLTDEEIFSVAAGAIAVPMHEPASSFVLHAPLELLARRTLLRAVWPDRREDVRERIIWVAATYARVAERLEPAPARAFESADAARSVLIAAAGQAELDDVDAAASWLAQHGSSDDVMAVAASMIDSLAAAGHASIYFFHLGRSAPHSRAALALLRPLAREVARYPQLRIEWPRAGVNTDDAGTSGTEPARHLAAALARAPRLGLPGSDFIFPTVHQVDAGGQARDLVDGSLPSDTNAARAAILGVAARSMLQDDPKFAPYGWSHCLTLPQSVLGILPWMPDTARATAIAATYVVAFRAAEGCLDVDLDWEPSRFAVAPREAIDAEPLVAAGGTFHASDADLELIVPELAARAAGHEDAHLAKYTLACFDAAADDPGQRRLYLAAAAYLGAWWRAQP